MFLDWLFGSSNTWSFTQVTNKLHNWQVNKVLPFKHNFPQYITLSSQLWSNLVTMYKSTFNDGRERAIDIWKVGDEIVFTKQVKGSKHSVSSGSRIEVKFKPQKNHKWYFDMMIYVNGALYKKKTIYDPNAYEIKKTKISHIFNFHTHPPHKDTHWNYYWNFYSTKDIWNLFKGHKLAIGLAIDNVYLVFRTQSSKMNENTRRFLTEEKLINNNFVVYKGAYRKKLVKLDSMQ